jgi:starch-binding outer membrane protein, SusD/RagB family
MRVIKVSNIILTASLALLLVACNKQLDVKPVNTVESAGFNLQNPDEVESAIVGCYSIMGGGALYGTNLFLLSDLLGSESYCSWRGTFQGFRQVAGKTMVRENSEASRTWIAGYRAINSANIVLASLGVVTDPDQKNQFEGEALFTRGTMLFEMVRYYALPFDPLTANTQLGIPIITTAARDEAAAFNKKARNTVAEVYAQVITDLTAAAAKLPEENGTRATKYTALAMLSRVYMQQSNFAKARDAADEVINSGYYELNASVTAVFSNKNSRESIWEIQQNDQNNAGTTNDGMTTFYASLVGIGRGDVRMNTTFVNSYNAADLRKTEWYYVGVGARPGNTYCGKWKSFSQNLPVIRLAEMYLNRAECNRRLGTNIGDTPENDLAEVRNPVRTNLASIVAPTLNNILTERNYELAFEGARIHDIRRLKGVTGAFAWDAPRLVFPIPQREIDANNLLVQNPGY